MIRVVTFLVELLLCENYNPKILVCAFHGYVTLQRIWISRLGVQVKDGKVVKHEDRWNHKPLAESTKFLRRGNMMPTHMLMGFGKDR